MTATATQTPIRTRGRVRRVLAIARYEVTLMARNKVVVMNALLFTPVLVAFLLTLGAPLTVASVVNLTAAMGFLMILYYNLTTIFVTRREERVFKRYATGEATEWEGLAAASIPSVVILLIQISLAAVLSSLVWGTPPLHNVALVVVGLVLATIIGIGLAAASTSFTKSVEAAQLSTMPVIFILMFTSGAVPMSFLPFADDVLRYSPLYALSQLIEAGFSDAGFTEVLATATRPTIVLIGWTIIAISLARRYMAFDPRR